MKHRMFLRTAAAGLAAPYLIPRNVLAAPGRPGANDRIAAGVIGTGGRISRVLSETPEDVRITALADIARQLGRRLQWDPEKEEFVGDDEANALRSRPRRKGYELPEIV